MQSRPLSYGSSRIENRKGYKLCNNIQLYIKYEDTNPKYEAITPKVFNWNRKTSKKSGNVLQEYCDTFGLSAKIKFLKDKKQRDTLQENAFFKAENTVLRKKLNIYLR